MKKSLFILAVLTACLCSCVQEELQPLPSEDGTVEESIGEETEVKFHITQTMTRSSLSINENQLDDVNIYAFCDGILYANVYSTTPNTVSIKLKRGTSYNLYAVANMGAVKPAAREADFIRECGIRVRSISDLQGKNPLAWSYSGYRLSSGNNSISMVMTRLLSKVHFKLDKGTLRGLDVKSVKLCQAANVVHPFLKGGSRAMSPSDVMDGDYASAEDLNSLNTTGEGIFFYTLENRQGSLLPDNSDPWKKIPSSISNGNLCTYIEVHASFKEGFFYSGNVTYRFYLGQDSTTNFDIIRNSDMSVLLTLTGDNFGEGSQQISWKVILDTGLTRTGYADYELVKHIHPGNLLYVSERFEMNVTLKEELFNHLDRDMANFYIAVIDPQTEQKVTGVVSLTPLKQVSIGEDANRFSCMGTVLSRSMWKYGLFDRRSDKLLAVLNNTRNPSGSDISHSPRIRLSTSATGLASAVANSPSDVNLNGSEVTYYVYLYDDDSKNMNALGLFGDASSLEEASRSISMSMYDGLSFSSKIYPSSDRSSGKDGSAFVNVDYRSMNNSKSDVPYIGTLRVRATNDLGRDQDLISRAISQLLDENGKMANLEIAPAPSNRYVSTHAPLFHINMLPVTVDPHTSISSNGDRFRLRVENPSKVALDIGSMLFVDASNRSMLMSGYPFKQSRMKSYPCQRNGTQLASKSVGTFIIEGPDYGNLALAWERNKCPFSRYMHFDRFTNADAASGEGKLDFYTSNNGDFEYEFNRMMFEQRTGGETTCAPWGIRVDVKLHTTTGPIRIPAGKVKLARKQTSDQPFYSSVSSMDKLLDSYNRNIYSPSRLCYDRTTEDNFKIQDWKTLYDGWIADMGTLTADKTGLIVTNELNSTINFDGRLLLEGKYKGDKFTMPYTQINTADVEFTTSQSQYTAPSWESGLELWHTSSFEKVWWHTAIHTKAGKHVYHPYVYQISLNNLARFQAIRSSGYRVVPFMFVPTMFTYTRDHIDKDAPKNDDSVYGYTVTVWFENDMHKIYDWPAAWRK